MDKVLILDDEILADVYNVGEHHSPSTDWFKKRNFQITDLINSHRGFRKVFLEQIGTIDYPYYEMGKINSNHLLNLNELIIFAIFKSSFRKGATLLDLGANIGLHSIVAAKLGYEVVSFEPDPTHFEQFSSLRKLNSLENSIRMEMAAISNSTGKSKFIRVEENSTSSHLTGSIGKTPQGVLNEFDVNTMDVNEVLKENFSLVKVDIEGYESIIFESLSPELLKRTDFIVEVGSRESASRIYSLLAKLDVPCFSQKIGWREVFESEHMPSNYKEGSLFIAGKSKDFLES